MPALLAVLHEDEDLLVVDKPAGLVCHPSKTGELSSLVGRVRLYLGHVEGRLVNRLDRETSGIVLIAKSAAAARELGALFATGRARKTYMAIVHGHVAGDLHVDAPVGDDETSPVAIKGCVRGDGASAVTEVRPVRTFERSDAPFSVVEVWPRTGRKHQIRIHLAHAGHPIVGDKIYGGDERRYLRFVARQMTDADREALLLEHHALHAGHLALSWRAREWAWAAAAPREFHEFSSGV
jgi:23S rRNA pseudouridine1911/1915/1917 synthase